MRGRLIIYTVVFLLVLNVIMVNFLNDSGAKDSGFKLKSTNIRYPNPRGNDYVLGQIQVISEPILGQDNNTRDSNQPRIVVEGDNIYTVWYDSSDYNGAGTDNDIFYRYYNSSAWSDIQVISEPVAGCNTNTGNSRWPSIAVENGKIYVAWQDNFNTNGAGTDIDIFLRCNTTGNSWDDIEVISEPTIGSNVNTGISNNPQIAVEKGNIYVTWADKTNLIGSGTDKDFFFRFKNKGSSWGHIQVPNEPIPGKNFNIDDVFTNGNIAVENGNIYIVWCDRNNTEGAGAGDGDVFFRCCLKDEVWGDIKPISEPIFGQNTNTGSSDFLDIEVENGEIYVLWRGTGPETGAGGDREIFLRCNLTGISWEDVFVISEPVQGKNLNIGDSLIAQDGLIVENGNIFTVWHDNNDTNNATNMEREIFFRCYLNGKGWEPIKVISEPIEGQNIMTSDSKWPSITVNSGKCHIAWQSYNYTNCGFDHDIFYRTIQAPVSPLYIKSTSVTPNSGNTSTEFNFPMKYYHLNNTAPTEINLYLDDMEYLLNERDQFDTNYSDGKEYYCKLSNLDIGRHEYYFMASDGIDLFTTRTINRSLVINTKPKITTQDNITAIEDTYFETTYEFVDIDRENIGQTHSWEFTTNATWLKFSTIQGTNTGTLYGTPTNDDVGKYLVDIRINDGLKFDQRKFNLTVLDVNDQPIITTEDVLTIYEDKSYQVFYEAIDIDSPQSKQIWNLNSNATTWLKLNSTSGELFGTPSNKDVGYYWVNITVNDTEGGYDSSNFALEVINVNDPPKIITKNEALTYTGILYKVDYDATDIDSNFSKQTWSLKSDASWLSIDEDTGVLSGTPPHSDPGWFSINVTVDDGDGGTDTLDFLLRVIKSNEPPVITTEDIGYAKVNESYYVEYKAIDDSTPEDLLFWKIQTNATWLDIDSSSGVLSGKPRYNDGGRIYWVNVSVIDAYYGLSFHNFTVTIDLEPIKENYIPKLLNIRMSPDQGNTETEFTFSIYYSDGNSEKAKFIQVLIDEKPFDLLLKPDEIAYAGKYELKTTLTEGEHTYYFTASDGIDTVRSDDFKTSYIDRPQVEDGKDGGGDSLVIGAIIVVIIIIVILILSFLMLQRKKKREEKNISGPEQSSVPPSVYPAVITQQVPVQPQLQPTLQQLPVQQLQTTAYYTAPVSPTPEQQQHIQQPQPYFQENSYSSPTPDTPTYDPTPRYSTTEQPQQIKQQLEISKEELPAETVRQDMIRL